MSAKAAFDRYVAEVLSGHRVAIAGELIADTHLRGRSEHIAGAFPDLEVETRVALVEGDLVAAHVVARGTHAGVFLGIPATQNRCEMRCTGIYRVESGRIVDAWVTWDNLSLMEQLGAVERVAAVSA